MGKSPAVTSVGADDRPPRSTSDLVTWVLRVVWLVLPLAVGPALGAALDDRSAGVQAVGTVASWGTWVVVLVALLVPRATSLTVVRIGVPGALAAAGWAAGPGSPDDDVARAALAVAAAAVTTALAFASTVGDLFVNGSAYGAERRFALRCPPALGALAAVAWAAVAVGAVTGPLLLGAEQWVLGGLATIVGAAAVVAGGRSLHGLSRRWLVFVPSGLVVHDPIARPESVMAPRPLIERIAPAVDTGHGVDAGGSGEGTGDVDLTLGAPGLALELATTEPIPVTVRAPGRELVTEEATRVLFTPTRPTAVLDEATARRLPVGAAGGAGSGAASDAGGSIDR